jgi:hypothetical protein
VEGGESVIILAMLPLFSLNLAIIDVSEVKFRFKASNGIEDFLRPTHQHHAIREVFIAYSQATDQ